jgi:hypothetical protein
MWEEQERRDLERQKLGETVENLKPAWFLLGTGLPLVVLAAWWVSGPRVVPFLGVTKGGLPLNEVEILEVLVSPGDVVAWEQDLLVVDVGERDPGKVRSKYSGQVVELHVAPGETLTLREPIVTLRDPYARDTFACRLLTAAALYLLLLPTSLLTLRLLSRSLKPELPAFRYVLARMAAYSAWCAASGMVLYHDRVPVVLFEELADLGILVFLATVAVLAALRFWLFSVLFKQDWFETVVIVLVLALVEYGLWRLVDAAAVWLQT